MAGWLEEGEAKSEGEFSSCESPIVNGGRLLDPGDVRAG